MSAGSAPDAAASAWNGLLALLDPADDDPQVVFVCVAGPHAASNSGVATISMESRLKATERAPSRRKAVCINDMGVIEPPEYLSVWLMLVELAMLEKWAYRPGSSAVSAG